MTLRWLRLAIVAGGILFSSNLASGQDNEVELTDNGIGIGLVLPPGLSRVSDQQMAILREKGVNAKFFFTDAKVDRLLVVNTFGSNASEAGLSKVADDIVASAHKEQTFVEVVKRGLITIKGKKWLQLILKQGTGEDRTIDTFFATDWVGRYVVLEFSAAVPEYEGYRVAIEKSIRTVRLSLIAETPGKTVRFLFDNRAGRENRDSSYLRVPLRSNRGYTLPPALERYN